MMSTATFKRIPSKGPVLSHFFAHFCRVCANYIFNLGNQILAINAGLVFTSPTEKNVSNNKLWCVVDLSTRWPSSTK